MKMESDAFQRCAFQPLDRFCVEWKSVARRRHGIEINERASAASLNVFRSKRARWERWMRTAGGPAKSSPGFLDRGERLAVFRLAPGNCCESLQVAARRGEKLDSDGSGTAGWRTVTPRSLGNPVIRRLEKCDRH
jgi:hypothetical protein